MLLEVTALTKRYGRVVGVAGVEFHVSGGEIVGLLGPNGSGKSTTLHCVTGLLEATEGDIRVGGVPLKSRLARTALACPRRSTYTRPTYRP